MKAEKKIKIAFLLTFAAVLSVSIYQNNMAPIVCMGLGVMAGPLGSMIGGATGIILTFYFSR